MLFQLVKNRHANIYLKLLSSNNYFEKSGPDCPIEPKKFRFWPLPGFNTMYRSRNLCIFGIPLLVPYTKDLGRITQF